VISTTDVSSGAVSCSGGTSTPTTSPAKTSASCEVFRDAGGVFHHIGTAERVAGPDPARRAKRSLASFSDPDGNGWILQEAPRH
jgi:hypothetical protein